eukprot:Partr_v1_DN28483_c0_g2_i1_m41996 putative Clathrin interactor 1
MNSTNINLPWDVKSALNKVKNAVMNYTEMEAKVREATSNDPWGASSTLLLEISRGTQNYQYFNEIMPMIYKRFTENRAQWRHVYKSLQLIEYLLKHGSDRVVENVRDHIYEIKTFQSYQMIDEKGKDQGVNVRHRAKEICDLVNDSQRLREERHKAQENRNKYQGVASDDLRSYSGGGGGGGGFDSHYGGSFASDRRSGDISGGGYPGNSRPQYEEYNPHAGSSRPSLPSRPDDEYQVPGGYVAPVAPKIIPAASVAPVGSAPQNDLLLDFGGGASAVKSNKPAASWEPFPDASNGASDGFADFQSAPVIHSNISPLAAPPTRGGASFSQSQQPQFGGVDLFASPPQQQPQMAPSFGAFPQQPQQQQQQNFGGFQQQQATSWGNFSSAAPVAALNQAAPPMQPLNASKPGTASNSIGTSKKVGDIWESNLVALDSLGKFGANESKNGPSLNQLKPTSPMPQANAFGGFGQPLQQQQQQSQQWPTQSKQPQNGFGAFEGGGSLL